MQRIRGRARKMTLDASILLISKMGRQANFPQGGGFCHCQRAGGLVGAGRLGKTAFKKSYFLDGKSQGTSSSHGCGISQPIPRIQSGFLGPNDFTPQIWSLFFSKGAKHQSGSEKSPLSLLFSFFFCINFILYWDIAD